MMFEADNVNNNCKNAELLERNQIYNLDPFNSLVPAASACIPNGQTKIQVHIIYD